MAKQTKKRDRIYEIWRGMVRRTTDPSSKNYNHYHNELHVTVCDEWMDFETFKEWALTHGYRDNLTIDRVNNHKGYRPNNCRWISRKAQAQNRSTCIRVNINGTTKTLSEWAKHYGIRKDRITRRIQAGWDPVLAITTPVKKTEKKKE